MFLFIFCKNYIQFYVFQVHITILSVASAFPQTYFKPNLQNNKCKDGELLKTDNTCSKPLINRQVYVFSQPTFIVPNTRRSKSKLRSRNKNVNKKVFLVEPKSQRNVFRERIRPIHSINSSEKSSSYVIKTNPPPIVEKKVPSRLPLQTEISPASIFPKKDIKKDDFEYFDDDYFDGNFDSSNELDSKELNKIVNRIVDKISDKNSHSVIEQESHTTGIVNDVIDKLFELGVIKEKGSMEFENTKFRKIPKTNNRQTSESRPNLSLQAAIPTTAIRHSSALPRSAVQVPRRQRLTPLVSNFGLTRPLVRPRYSTLG